MDSNQLSVLLAPSITTGTTISVAIGVEPIYAGVNPNTLYRTPRTYYQAQYAKPNETSNRYAKTGFLFCTWQIGKCNNLSRLIVPPMYRSSKLLQLVRSDSNAFLAVLETAVLPIKLPTYGRLIWAVCLHLRAGYQPTPISFFIFAGCSRNIPCYPGATRTHGSYRTRTYDFPLMRRLL